MTTEAGAISSRRAQRQPATSSPNRSAISRASWPACRSPRRQGARRRAGAAAGRGCRARAGAGRPRRRRAQAQDRVLKAGGKLSDQEKFKREQHPFDGYERLKAHGRARNESPSRRQFPLALLRPVLCGAGAELLHVPAAHPGRHPQAAAVRRRRRHRRALRRRLRPHHHPRQSADPRDRRRRTRSP